MKYTFFYLAAAACMLASCSNDSIKVVVENSMDFDRKGELVEVKTDLLKADFSTRNYVLKDAAGAEIGYQLSESNGAKVLLFQADVAAKSSTTYTLVEGNPQAVAKKTAARYVPERKDDFAWENDLAAYRMYGPALANEYPSNGADVWMKCTEEPIMDKFYADDLERGISYHVNNGLGLDCYDVKHTLGAGGITPFTSQQLWIGNHYDRYAIIETGPLRSVFTLTYDSVQVEDTWYQEVLTITTDAGSMLNKAVVRYTGVDKPMKLAGGITLHNGGGIGFADVNHKVLALAEDAVSNGGVPQGRSYVGIYMPESNEDPFEKENHLIIVADYTVGTDFTYYFGGGWSEWKYPTDEDWSDALVRFSQAKKEPLKVVIR
jgi:hypothetical protein